MSDQNTPLTPSPRDFDRELKELEVLTKQHDLASKKHEFAQKTHWLIRWNNPVALALLAALAGYFGTLITWTLARSDDQARHQRMLELEESKQEATERLEMKKLEGSLILDAVKTGEGSEKAERAAANLLLLADARLITLDDATRKTLAERAGSVGPGLPSMTANAIMARGILGPDDAVPVTSLSPNSPLRSPARCVGLFQADGPDGKTAPYGTAFLIGEDLALTAYHVTQGATNASLRFNDGAGDYSYEVELPPLDEATDEDGLNFALLRVKGKPGATHGWLNLAHVSPRLHAPVACIFYRGAPPPLVVSDAPDCRVLEVSNNVFTHRCDTGPGASGAPVLSSDGRAVLGVHFRRNATGGVAVRADLIAHRVRIHLP